MCRCGQRCPRQAQLAPQGGGTSLAHCMPQSNRAARAGCRQASWGDPACQVITRLWPAMLPGCGAVQHSLSGARPSWKAVRSLPEQMSWQQPDSAAAAGILLDFRIGPQCLQADASVCPALQASSTCSTLGTQRHWSRPRSCECCLPSLCKLMQRANRALWHHRSPTSSCGCCWCTLWCAGGP